MLDADFEIATPQVRQQEGLYWHPLTMMIYWGIGLRILACG